MVLIRHLLTVRMPRNLFSRLHMGSNMTQIQALFSPTILEVQKKLKAHASNTKFQQLCALKFLFYTALQIMFLFVYRPIVSTVTTSSLLDSTSLGLQASTGRVQGMTSCDPLSLIHI